MEYTVSVNNLTRFPDYLFHISNSPKKQANILSYLIVIQIEISWQSTTSILFIHRKRFNDIFSSGPNDTFDKPLYQTDSSIIPCSNFNHINSNTFFDEWWCQSICQTKYSSSRKHKKSYWKLLKFQFTFCVLVLKYNFCLIPKRTTATTRIILFLEIIVTIVLVWFISKQTSQQKI